MRKRVFEASGALRRSALFLVAVALGLTVAESPGIREAGACSCVGPQSVLLTPDRADDAPINTRVRVEIASGAKTTPNVVLRHHATGAEVPATSRTMASGGWLTLVELTPQKALSPGTRYVVAVVDPAQHPPTTILGTFVTGTSADTAPPQIDAMGAAAVHRNANAYGGSCQVHGPWVTIETLRASDPGRREAQMLYGVWLGDAQGRFDTSKAPVTMLRGYDDALHIGQMSLCDPHAFPFPKSTSVAWLGIAALDEAGNASALRRVKVDLLAGAPP